MTSLSSPLLRARSLAAIAVLVLAAIAPVALGLTPPQPLPSQRVDLRVLVVGQNFDPTESRATWEAALRREGIPFDTLDDNAVNDGTLADYNANRAKYQAVIVVTGEQLFGPAQTALTKYESTFGIRQITDAGNEFNLNPYRGIDSLVNPPGFSEQGGQVGQLTDLGRHVFPYLKGPVPIVGGAFGYQAVPTASPSFQRLVNGPGNSVYLGIYTDPLDLRQQMVMTVSSNEVQLHSQLLRHGMLNWVTRGVYLGTQRNYFAMHIDDIFLPDAKWDAVNNTTPGNAAVPTCELAGAPVTCPEVRMQPNDVRDAIVWQNTNGLKFDFLFNQQGIQDAIDANALKVPPIAGDPLTSDPTYGLLQRKSEFRWMNHTDTHAQLDAVGLVEANREINNNNIFAAANALPGYNPAEIVTGEHSGIGSYLGPPLFGAGLNINVRQAFFDRGIQWVGDDNSVQPTQRQIGPAVTVPRYPSNVYYNVASRADQLDEYNWIYRSPTVPVTPEPNTGNCTAIPNVTTCRASAAQWLVNDANGELSYLNSEVGIMFGHLMGNDPKPHYAHQSNLITNHFVPGTTTPAADDGLGILFKRVGTPGDDGILDALLRRYNTYFNVPLVQPTMTESGLLLQKKALWDGHVAAGRASGYLIDGKVHVVATQGMEVALTGVNVGDTYGGQRSGWTTVGIGDTVFTPVDPANAAPPTITGNTNPGNTLTAVTGAWTGTSVPGIAPITLNYQWQRCNGPICVNIAGVVDSNYTTGAIDNGFGIRVVQMAGNFVSSVSQAFSATAAIPGPKPPAGQVPPTAPALGNVAAGVTKLRLTNLRVNPRAFKATKVLKRKVIGGTIISWRVNALAKITITVQKKKGKRWINVGSIQRDAKAGNGRYRFTGRLITTRAKSGNLAPGAYRFAIGAKGRNNTKTKTQTITFTLRKG